MAISDQRCYRLSMSNLQPRDASEMESIPVITMVDVPILSVEEKAAFLQTLVEAEKDIAEGKGIVLNADEIGEWLASLTAAASNTKLANV